jgi:hypothetical protein
MVLALLHSTIVSIEFDRWKIHLNEWKNKIANDVEYQKQKQEDLLVLGCYELIIAYFESFNIPGIREPFKNNTFKSQFDQEQYENNHAMLPMIDCYVEMNGSEGYYESNCGFFDFVDLKDWIREMIRSVENEKYCKYVDISFIFSDTYGGEENLFTIQEELPYEDIPETEDNSCPCGNCVN